MIQFIIPTTKLLTVWRLSNSSLCNFCQIEEDYIHLFMSCKYLSYFWKKVTELIKKVNFEINISLKHLVLGYTIFDKEYFDFNYILAILGYSIYKSFYVSEQKTKAIDAYSLFVRELRSRLNFKMHNILIYRSNHILSSKSCLENLLGYLFKLIRY